MSSTPPPDGLKPSERTIRARLVDRDEVERIHGYDVLLNALDELGARRLEEDRVREPLPVPSWQDAAEAVEHRARRLAADADAYTSDGRPTVGNGEADEARELEHLLNALAMLEHRARPYAEAPSPQEQALGRVVGSARALVAVVRDSGAFAEHFTGRLEAVPGAVDHLAHALNLLDEVTSR